MSARVQGRHTRAQHQTTKVAETFGLIPAEVCLYNTLEGKKRPEKRVENQTACDSRLPRDCTRVCKGGLRYELLSQVCLRDDHQALGTFSSHTAAVEPCLDLI